MVIRTYDLATPHVYLLEQNQLNWNSHLYLNEITQTNKSVRFAYNAEP